jgi:hypothetical protein
MENYKKKAKSTKNSAMRAEQTGMTTKRSQTMWKNQAQARKTGDIERMLGTIIPGTRGEGRYDKEEKAASGRRAARLSKLKEMASKKK